MILIWLVIGAVIGVFGYALLTANGRAEYEQDAYRRGYEAGKRGDGV